MDFKRPFVVVLTGGIASGKTAVSDRFAGLDVPIVDTDVIARQLVQPGEPALISIARHFGQQILHHTGHLDRRKLREVIFSDAKGKKQLEAILHPAIATAAKGEINSAQKPYCILVVPLLVESGLFEWGDRILLVDVDEETQILRVMARDQVNRKQANAALKAQASRQQRLSIADDVIQNTGALKLLDTTVLQLHRKYLDMANQSKANKHAGGPEQSTNDN
jgi:dephospho-CoA kinase